MPCDRDVRLTIERLLADANGSGNWRLAEVYSASVHRMLDEERQKGDDGGKPKEPG